MFHGIALNSINHMHERSLIIVVKDYHGSFKDLIKKDKSVCNCHRNTKHGKSFHCNHERYFFLSESSTIIFRNIPANICWSSRHVLKTSSTRLQRNNFTSSKTSSRRLGRRKIVTLKTSSRHLEDMSWRRLEDISWRRLQDVLETNKSKCAYLWSSKSTFNKSFIWQI